VSSRDTDPGRDGKAGREPPSTPLRGGEPRPPAAAPD